MALSRLSNTPPAHKGFAGHWIIPSEVPLEYDAGFLRPP